MRKILFFIVTVSILIPLSAPASTEQLGIGVFDYIISRTDFNVETCEAYSCNYVSADKTIKMELRRANLAEHNGKDLNFLLDIDFDSKLFKSGLLVRYYNDKDLIRVFIKRSSITIEATRRDEITKLQSWLKNVLSLVKKSLCHPFILKNICRINISCLGQISIYFLTQVSVPLLRL